MNTCSFLLPPDHCLNNLQQRYFAQPISIYAEY